MNTTYQGIGGDSKVLIIRYFGDRTIVTDSQDHVFSYVTPLGKVLFYQIKLFHSNPES